MTSEKWETIKQIAARLNARPEAVVESVIQAHRRHENVVRFVGEEGHEYTEWKTK